MSTLLGIILVVYLAVGTALFIKQRDFIYFPVGPVTHPFEEIVFHNGQESIQSIILNKGNTKAIIYFGGNSELVDDNAEPYAALFPHHTIYLVRYRGYGGSTGQPTEAGLFSDAQHIFDTVKPLYHSVIIVGRSLGSGVATFVASTRVIDKLILITPFDSAQALAQKQFWMYPMSLMLKDKFNSIDRVDSITANTLVIAAEDDPVVGRKHTQRLVNRFPPKQVTLTVIPNTGHNNISISSDYLAELKAFIDGEANNPARRAR